jgi:hypothetical protein
MYTGLFTKLPPVYGMVTKLLQVLPSVETSKPDGAVTVSFPAVGLRLVPVTENICTAEVVPTTTGPKATVVAVALAAGGGMKHEIDAIHPMYVTETSDENLKVKDPSDAVEVYVGGMVVQFAVYSKGAPTVAPL